MVSSAIGIMLLLWALQDNYPDTLNEAQLETVLVSTGWADQIDKAKCVTWYESSWRTDPVHQMGDPFGGSHGLWQINGWWATDKVRDGWPRFDMSQAGDPVYNSLYARSIWEETGWKAWATHELC